MMQLGELLANITDVQWPKDKSPIAINAVSCDSREDQQGALFVALGGYTFKGADFIADVIKKGAVAVVVSKEESLAIKSIPSHVALIITTDPKALLRTLVLRFYGNPSASVKSIGITGTNGKTTFTYLMESILHQAKQTCGVLGTINYRIGKEILPSKNTTPGFVDLQRFLFLLKARHAPYAVMEVSSHALAQGRVDGVNFSAAVFTNLTQDHLDYHHSMEEYFNAKALLFTGLSSSAFAIINADDPYGKRLCAMTKAKVVTYGINSKADINAESIAHSLTGTRMGIAVENKKYSISSPLIGRHNAYNVLSAFACAWALGFKPEDIKSGIEAITCIPGRLEPVTIDKSFHVFIDYAHTEDGLVNVLLALRAVTSSRIITVFGCGGDRDKTKRPKMGTAVCALSDYAIITSDNPRSENPQDIIDDIVAGFTKKNYEVCADRAKAIGLALAKAKPNEVVLLAGKGHEDYQILKDKTIPFNERDIVRGFFSV